MKRPPPLDLVLYVSGHGFGHAARCSALAAALTRRAPRLRLGIRGELPAWLFREAAPEAELSRGAGDPGMQQRDALRVDLERTAAAHAHHLARWDETLEQEAAWLRRRGARAVVSDVGALPCAAAARAGIPAFAVSNFSWDWILSTYAATWPELAAARACYAQAYALAELAFRLPLHGDFGAFRSIRDTPHLVRRATRSRPEVRRALGIPAEDDRPLVLVSFGGFGPGKLPPIDAPEMLFVGFGPSPPTLGPRWIPLPLPSPLPHPDLVAASDLVVGKTGYGTVSEVLCHGSRFLYLRRRGYPEDAVLAAGLRASGCAAEFPAEDFRKGRWRTHLEALHAKPPGPRAPADGDRVIARALLERLAS